MDMTNSNELHDEQNARIVAEMNAEMDEIKAKAKAAYLLKLQGLKAVADARRQQEDAAATAQAATVSPVAQQPRVSDDDHMSIDEASPTSQDTGSEDEEEGEVMEDVLSTWQPRKLKTGVPSTEASRSSSTSEAPGTNANGNRRISADAPKLAPPAEPEKPLEVARTASSIPPKPKGTPGPTLGSAGTAKRPSIDNSKQPANAKKSKQTPPAAQQTLSSKVPTTTGGGLASIKIRKKPGTNVDKTERASPESITQITERPPAWYIKLPNSNTRVPHNAHVLLERLKSSIKKGKGLTGVKGNAQENFDGIREELHKLAFETVTAPLLRSCRALHDRDGLPQLFDARFMDSMKVPWDIKADAEELYNKWCRQIFETDILRGIIAGKPASKQQERSVDSIDPEYEGKVDAKFHGNGLLLNGQWWPTQLATVRDGAHGLTIAGIYGKEGHGAYSCIMSGGHDYPDEDHGEWVKYCGTDSPNGSVTDSTQRMLESEKNGQPVRLIRSHNLVSAFAPEIGFRYDGLYKVVSHVNLDGVDSTRQRHQFKLVRLSGQDPIRGQEPAKRPTQQEMKAYEEHKRLRG